jgi:hypothetical protein
MYEDGESKCRVVNAANIQRERKILPTPKGKSKMSVSERRAVSDTDIKTFLAQQNVRLVVSTNLR